MRCTLGEAAAERFPCRREDTVDKLPLLAAPRHRKTYTRAAQGQSFLYQLMLDELMTEQNDGRLGAIVIELADKRSQHLLDGELAVVARKIRPIAPVLTPAKEENLHAGLPAGLVRGNHVGVDDP